MASSFAIRPIVSADNPDFAPVRDVMASRIGTDSRLIAGVSADLGADGSADVLALVASPSQDLALWYARGTGEPKLVEKIGGAHASCEPRIGGSVVSARAIVLTFSWSCKEVAPPSDETWIVRYGETGSVHVTETLKTFAPLGRAPATVVISPSAMDADGDGHDDVRLELSLLSAETQRTATAPLVWLDRAIGFALSDVEPSATIARLGNEAAALSARRARDASLLALDALLVFDALCTNGDGPLLRVGTRREGVACSVDVAPIARTALASAARANDPALFLRIASRYNQLLGTADAQVARGMRTFRAARGWTEEAARTIENAEANCAIQIDPTGVVMCGSASTGLTTAQPQPPLFRADVLCRSGSEHVLRVSGASGTSTFNTLETRARGAARGCDGPSTRFRLVGVSPQGVVISRSFGVDLSIVTWTLLEGQTENAPELAHAKPVGPSTPLPAPLAGRLASIDGRTIAELVRGRVFVHRFSQAPDVEGHWTTEILAAPRSAIDDCVLSPMSEAVFCRSKTRAGAIQLIVFRRS